ncbi:hypothetical protein [Candidatus Coxiella mudrowiae]|uniref:hypothetical protein n=1 Tax=Candidatus Coxiella mudrowiae TaxID=2054173 RepID=UPI001FCFC12D|nr:hypothetical protein [Candidatus Coxiella mudrowiae]
MCLLPTTPYSVNAVAIDQNTARTAVLGAVNNHYLFSLWHFYSLQPFYENFRNELLSQM